MGLAIQETTHPLNSRKTTHKILQRRTKYNFFRQKMVRSFKISLTATALIFDPISPTFNNPKFKINVSGGYCSPNPFNSAKQPKIQLKNIPNHGMNRSQHCQAQYFIPRMPSTHLSNDKHDINISIFIQTTTATQQIQPQVLHSIIEIQ